MKGAGSALLLVVVAGLAPSTVTAAEPAAGLEQWWNRVNAEVEALVATHKLVPPEPVALQWKAQRIWTGTLPGDLLDLQAADLGDDEKDELIALSSESVLVFSRHRGLFDVRSQISLPAAPATQRPRDAIGMLSIQDVQAADGGAEVLLRARGSEQEMGGVYAWRGGSLELVSEFLGYPLCEDGTIGAAPGRNYYLGKSAAWPGGAGAVLSGKLYSARCSRGIVDPTGAPVRYISDVAISGELTVRCKGGPGACSMPATQYPGVGYAYLVADLNRDGFAEVITTSTSARGGKDKLQVYSQGIGAPRLVFEREFDYGLLALAAGDFDGDGTLELLAAQRQPATGKVTLWRLN